MVEHVKFPSIGKFKDAVKEMNWLFKYPESKPLCKFTGTVKLHGTHADICRNFKNEEEHIWFQSRNRILSIGKYDNYGFKEWMSTRSLAFLDSFPRTSTLLVAGEFCGKNIQQTVAIEGLPYFYVIFGIKVDETWLRLDEISHIHDNSSNIYNIAQFPTFTMDIDFNCPRNAENALREITNKVEAECPVGKFFGVSGIGEGVVWHMIAMKESENEDEQEWIPTNPQVFFKVKGELHDVTVTKHIASAETEEVKDVDEFIKNVLTEQRLNQGIQYLKEMNISSIRPFLKWVAQDVFKEENDTITANGLNEKALAKKLSVEARKWFASNKNTAKSYA